MARWYQLLAVLTFAAIGVADNDFTYIGTPVPGEAFTITWTPGTYSKVDILLNHLTGAPYYVPTTSEPIATEIDNTGSYVWNVPTSIQGFLSLSIARDFQFPVSYSPMFTIGPYTSVSITYATTVPQSTACTSAIPSPTGFSPFLVPDKSTLMRVGFTTNIQWQPTSANTVTLILNPEESDSDTVASATIISNITNSGSFAWTPPNDSILTSDKQWYLSLVDDVTQQSSESDNFNIVTPDAPNSFTDPYPPPVIGQDHVFYWSPSSTPTVSILIIKAVPYSTVNITLADHIKNIGSFTWSVPSSDPTITPGIWDFSLIDDATGHEDSKIQLTIDATTPAICGPEPPNSFSSLLSSLRGTKTTSTGPLKSLPPQTTSPSLLSVISVLSSLSSVRAATVTKVTPRVSTDKPAVITSVGSSGTVTTAEQALGSQTTNSVNGMVTSGGTGTVGVVKTTSMAVAGSGRDGLLGGGWWLDVAVGAVGIVVGGLGPI